MLRTSKYRDITTLHCGLSKWSDSFDKQPHQLGLINYYTSFKSLNAITDFVADQRLVIDWLIRLCGDLNAAFSVISLHFLGKLPVLLVPLFWHKPVSQL